MREEIGAYEAKTNLPEILRRVEAGEVITVTRHGRPVADIVPASASRFSGAKTAVKSILLAQQKRMDKKKQATEISDEDLADMKSTGRR